MDAQHMAQVREKAALFYERARQSAGRVPVKARIILALFLVAAVFMAIHTALTAKDASLHSPAEIPQRPGLGMVDETRTYGLDRWFH
jgi:hypothetical protein